MRITTETDANDFISMNELNKMSSKKRAYKQNMGTTSMFIDTHCRFIISYASLV